MVEEYYRPQAIVFNQRQILWVLKHLYYIREGYWPVDHKETGYNYIGGDTRRKTGGYFEAPACIAAEVEHRLEQCGIDGMILEYSASLEYEDKVALYGKIARYLNTTVDDISVRVKATLAYCSGWRRHRTPYQRHLIQYRSYKKRQGRPA